LRGFGTGTKVSTLRQRFDVVELGEAAVGGISGAAGQRSFEVTT
jgi:hypothetical protein